MNNQEIANKLVNRRNFYEYVNICLNENLSIERHDCLPDILIYFNDTDYLYEETGTYKDVSTKYIRFNIIRDEFEVDGKLLSGPEKFFKNYTKITKFIINYEDTSAMSPAMNIIINVIPFITNKQHWYRNDNVVDGEYEISYKCHSMSKPSIIQKISDEIVNERYYINGTRLNYETWLKEIRKHKLSRIILKYE